MHWPGCDKRMTQLKICTGAEACSVNCVGKWIVHTTVRLFVALRKLMHCGPMRSFTLPHCWLKMGMYPHLNLTWWDDNITVILALAPWLSGSILHCYSLGCQFESRCGRVFEGSCRSWCDQAKVWVRPCCRPGGMTPHDVSNAPQVLRRQTH